MSLAGGGPCAVRSQPRGSLYSEVPCPERGGGGVLRLEMSLFGGMQCIMGNSHMGPTWTDRHDWKHYCPPTTLGSIRFFSWSYRNPFWTFRASKLEMRAMRLPSLPNFLYNLDLPLRNSGSQLSVHTLALTYNHAWLASKIFRWYLDCKSRTGLQRSWTG